MSFAKVAFARRVLRTGADSMAKEAAPQDLPVIRAAGRGLLSVGKSLGRGAWSLAGHGAESMVGKRLAPVATPAVLALGGAGVYSAGKAAYNQGKVDYRGFDPNVQAAMATPRRDPRGY